MYTNIQSSANVSFAYILVPIRTYIKRNTVISLQVILSLISSKLLVWKRQAFGALENTYSKYFCFSTTLFTSTFSQNTVFAAIV